MIQQSVIKIGNSLGITFPADYVKKVGLKPGKKVYVEPDLASKNILVHITEQEPPSGLTPEFKVWTDNFMKKNAKLMRALAKV